MADPESSHYGLVLGFWPSTPSPRLRLRMQRLWPLPLWEQHTTTTLHHSPTLFDAAGPEPSHSGLVSRFRPPSSSLLVRPKQQQWHQQQRGSTSSNGRSSTSSSNSRSCCNGYKQECDANYERRPARASMGVTHTGQHGPAQVQHKLRGRGEQGRGAAAAQQLQQRWALPRPTFFVLFFYLANMSRLVVVPSPDLLTYFNVIKCNSNNFL
jgi:hypothetical protein